MSQNLKNDDRGFFGEYGGTYSPEALMPILEELRIAFRAAEADPVFMEEFHVILRDWGGRPTPLYYAGNLSREYGAGFYFKREDLMHGGAHKTNNAIGQVLLAKRMGKTRIIAETGAGQHGVATAMACAKLGMPCVVYMGAVDVARQAPNVDRMKLLGAEVVAVQSGGKTLKDAINEALRDWIASCDTTHYVIGTAAGPHPFPTMVKLFQSIIGREARAQCLDQIGRLPDYALACVGGGSNAIGLFSGFVEDKAVHLIGIEPGGHGIDTDKHGAVLCKGTVAVLHGMRTLGLQDKDGQIFETHSISAGLDYPLIGPEHAYLRDAKRASYVAVTDDEAVDAFQIFTRSEGIIPALESSHAIAYALKLAQDAQGKTILVNLSGRGDKDLAHVAEYLAEKK
ncbi:MAG: tryptophan synthase subunit beta [Alphaproteobacteria bacterium CG1_02_46_17]|nr:MAG: tryptophan synthase subunit beta [Alphaproteobacteria bacterium CG1_02_46_17]